MSPKSIQSSIPSKLAKPSSSYLGEPCGVACNPPKTGELLTKDPAAPAKENLSGDAGELALHTAVSVRVPALHDIVPERVYPESQVGLHDAPLARELVHVPTAPFVGAADASHGVAVQAALSVRAPAVHDLVPDRV